MIVQQSLFTSEDEVAPQIEGLIYVAEFITTEEELELLSIIDKQPWINDLKRRVQHYGYRYDYTAKKVSRDSYLGKIPNWLQNYCDKLHADGHFSETPDQVIINEYQPGQGISAHVDRPDCFGDRIGTISLGSPCVMDLTNIDTGEKFPVLLEKRSLAMMTGEARYGYKHCIPNRKSDKYQEQKITRDRRVSITFRNVIYEQ